ncbi:hypothetical protein CR513_08532, partial [Mucuna pruriens]
MWSKLATSKASQHQTTFNSIVKSPAIDEAKDYLTKGTTPNNKIEDAKIKRRASRYLINVDELYQRGLFTPLLKCLMSTQATYIMDEIHRDICWLYFDKRTMPPMC